MPYKDPNKQKVAQRASYLRTRERQQQYNRRYRKQMRDWLATLKASVGCANCNERDPICLDYHHKDPTTKSYEISDMISRYGKDDILAEIAKCELLCCNCHRKEERRLRCCK